MSYRALNVAAILAQPLPLACETIGELSDHLAGALQERFDLLTTLDQRADTKWPVNLENLLYVYLSNRQKADTDRATFVKPIVSLLEAAIKVDAKDLHAQLTLILTETCVHFLEQHSICKPTVKDLNFVVSERSV